MGHCCPLWSEAVLVVPEFRIYDASYSVQNEPIINFCDDANQAYTTIVVGICKVTRLWYWDDVHVRPQVGLVVVYQRSVTKIKTYLVKIT